VAGEHFLVPLECDDLAFHFKHGLFPFLQTSTG
jgi:hypothetical protein